MNKNITYLLLINNIKYVATFNITRYQTKETIVREQLLSTAKAVGDSDTPFLDLVICPSYGAAYKDDMLNHYGINKQKYRTKGHFTPNNKSENIDPRKVFNSITHDVTELLHSVKIYPLDRHVKFTTDFDELNHTQYIKITTKYWHNYGRCFSIQPKDHVLKTGVTIIDIIARMNVYVYFGYPGQFMYNTKTKVIINY